jgi:hypothetical protein
MNRVYESNGPDVKVRGTAQTIAEKYLQLGRDAHASGDIVMSESYFQHAEHYLRILAAAQSYNQQMQQQYRRPDEEFEDDEGDESEDTGEAEATPIAAEGGEQTPPAQGEAMGGDDEFRPQQNQQREFRPRDRDNRDRDRDRGSHRQRFDNRDNRRDMQEQPRDFQPREQQPQVRGDEPQPVMAEASASGDVAWEAPSFLRKPSANGSGGSRPRPERRRREAAEGSEGAVEAEPASVDVPQGE